MAADGCFKAGHKFFDGKGIIVVCGELSRGPGLLPPVRNFPGCVFAFPGKGPHLGFGCAGGPEPHLL